MTVSNANAEQSRRENNPVVGGRQYQATEVIKKNFPCDGCAASLLWGTHKNICNALPPCMSGERKDGREVVFVDIGPAPEEVAV